MPVKLGSKLLTESAEARIEIVPLIDIMFFLLAAFMLVSLSMVTMKSVKVNLPTATTANPDTRRDLVDVSVDRNGGVFLDKAPVGDNELIRNLSEIHRNNPNVRVFLSGDKAVDYGAVVHALDLVREAGVQNVAFEVRSPDKQS